MNTQVTYRLSPAQEWLLTLERLRMGRGLQLTKVIRLPDGTDDATAERAVRSLFAEHSALRTRIVRTGGRFGQVVEPVGACVLDRIDTDEPVGTVLARLVAEERATPVDPARQPARVRLLRAGSGPPLLVLTCHHALADWWSLEIVADHLVACCRSEVPPVPPCSFAEHADRLAEWSASPAGELAYRYWARTLAGAAPVPLDTGRPVSGAGATTQGLVRSSIGDSACVTSVARAAGATAFAVLLAAFGVVLRDRTGQADVLVGSQLANRGEPALQRLVGCLTSTVLLRIVAEPGRPFVDLVRDSQDVLRGAYRHGQVDLRRVYREAGIGGGPGPVPPSILFQQVPALAATAPALPPDLVPIARPGQGLPVDLHVGVSIDGADVRCEVEFNEAAVDAGLAAGLVDDLAAQLRTAATEIGGRDSHERS